MAQQKASEDIASRAIINNCHRIQQEINTKTGQLDAWEDKLNILLSDTESDLDEISTIWRIREGLNKEILNLRAEQKSLGCVSNGTSDLPQDNQTIISTSMVRRKDARALQIISDEYSTQKK